LPLSEKL